MERGRPARRALSAGLAAGLLALAGCGDDSSPATVGASAEADPGGVLELAVATRVSELDPLLARTRGEQLAARQLYEPLVDRLRGPFEQVRVRDGLLVSIRPSPAGDQFTARLRSGVRFSNGQLLDADAVLANVERWQASPVGRELLGPLRAAFSPRPGVLRFALDEADPGFPERLSDPRLGIASPGAVSRAVVSGGGLESSASGTGPFELRDPGEEPDIVLLVRRPGWWGSDLGLGPGVDQIRIQPISDAADRVEALLAGEVRVADSLSRRGARRAERAPLTTVVSGGGARLGEDLSVRGLDSADPGQSLADVWLADLG